MKGFDLRSAGVISHPHRIRTELSFGRSSSECAVLELRAGVGDEVHVVIEAGGDQISSSRVVSLSVPGIIRKGVLDNLPLRHNIHKCAGEWNFEIAASWDEHVISGDQIFSDLDVVLYSIEWIGGRRPLSTD